jgi:hypothetical protein
MHITSYDGCSTAEGSSMGATARIAAYDWLDMSIGTDCTCFRALESK